MPETCEDNEGKDQELEEALFVWFRRKREEGVPLTGSLVIIQLMTAK